MNFRIPVLLLLILSGISAGAKPEKPPKIGDPRVFSGSSSRASHVITSEGEHWSWGYYAGGWGGHQIQMVPEKIYK